MAILPLSTELINNSYVWTYIAGNGLKPPPEKSINGSGERQNGMYFSTHFNTFQSDDFDVCEIFKNFNTI